MREILLRHSLITVAMLFIGIVLYFIINFLLSFPGSKTIDRIYETDDEKRQKKAGEKKVTKIYIVALIWLVIASNFYMAYIN